MVHILLLLGFPVDFYKRLKGITNMIPLEFCTYWNIPPKPYSNSRALKP